MFSAAAKRNVQFKLVKSKFAFGQIPLLGFVAGRGERKVQPEKAQALKDWPDPSNTSDVVSLRAYGNYLREFIPNFMKLDQRLKTMTKKNADFTKWMEDPENMKAFSDLRNALRTSIAFNVADFDAAQDPELGRPFELFVDACDYGWGCTLCQRLTKGGPPRPIAAYSRSFSGTEQAWFTFERELFGIRDALVAIEHIVKGFPVVVYTDHKNNLFTGSLLGNKRMQKKLLRWTFEIDELSRQVLKVCLDQRRRQHSW